MEFKDVIATRRSVRRYSDRDVEEEKVLRTLEAARIAPSWANKQCWDFIVIRKKETREAVAKGVPFNSWLKTAPVIIVGCGNPKKSGTRNGMDYYLVDMGIAMEHLILAAKDEGLSTCWIGGFDEEAIRETLSIPPDMKIVALTPIGYPAEESTFGSKLVKRFIGSGKRRTLEEITHREKW